MSFARTFVAIALGAALPLATAAGAAASAHAFGSPPTHLSTATSATAARSLGKSLGDLGGEGGDRQGGASLSASGASHPGGAGGTKGAGSLGGGASSPTEGGSPSEQPSGDRGGRGAHGVPGFVTSTPSAGEEESVVASVYGEGEGHAAGHGVVGASVAAAVHAAQASGEHGRQLAETVHEVLAKLLPQAKGLSVAEAVYEDGVTGAIPSSPRSARGPKGAGGPITGSALLGALSALSGGQRTGADLGGAAGGRSLGGVPGLTSLGRPLTVGAGIGLAVKALGLERLTAAYAPPSGGGEQPRWYAGALRLAQELGLVSRPATFAAPLTPDEARSLLTKLEARIATFVPPEASGGGG